MNPFLLGPEERLTTWKAFRGSLRGMDEQEQLGAVARYWAQAPIDRYAYEPLQPETWPTPWEMIAAGDWCENSLAIGMEFTLRLSGWTADRLSLLFWRDLDFSFERLVLKIDDRYLLNYHVGIVCEIPLTQHVVVSRVRYDHSKYRPAAD